MTDGALVLRTDETPCLLFPELVERGGGLQRAVQERASLYARHRPRVLLLTTGFSGRWQRVSDELKERGSLDRRVEVRNYFAHSAWAAGLGVPPLEAYAVPGEEGVSTRPQRLRGRGALRLADRRDGQRQPFRYRYFDGGGRLLLTTFSGLASKHEQTAVDPEGQPVDLAAMTAAWVDDEIAGATRPVLFSLQRGYNDPVLLASARAYRKVASLHNCHYNDPQDRRSGIRPSFRPLFTRAFEIDQIVCLTEQQRQELVHDVPAAQLVSIPYPGRPPREEAVEKDPALVVLVGQLIDRKRVDHAIRAMVDVVAAVPQARLEVYGEGPDREALEQLVGELGLEGSVRLMGYSHEVGQAQARAACALMTSTFEGFARVISESMSRGTPVISYDVRYGPRDLVRHGVDGLLVAEHRPAALAAAIVALLTDPERALEMGRRAREVLDRFPVPDFEDAWLGVLAAPPRRRTPLARVRDVGKRLARTGTFRRLRRLSTVVPRGRQDRRPPARTPSSVRPV